MVKIILQGINPSLHNNTSFYQHGSMCKYVTGSLEVAVAYFITPKVTVTFLVGMT